jgi:hypothetical protein
MALKGNLKDFSLTQILNLVNLARKTGMLGLERPGTPAARLFFREGKLMDASLDGQPAELTTLLLRIGKISTEQQKSILSQVSVRTEKETGLLLINSGYVTQADIVQAVRSHLLDTIYLLFTWPDGTFQFEPGAFPSDDRISVPIYLEGVIMEGTRRIQEWEMLQDELPDLDMAMKFSTRPNTNLRDINLSVDEWRVISFINPRNPIKQIAEVNKMNEFQIRKIVYRMLSAGLVELIQPEGAAPKRLITRPQTVPPATAVGRRPAPTLATAGGPASVPAPGAAARPNRNVILRLIDRIKRL